MCLVLLIQCLIKDISAKEVSENILQGDVSGTSFKFCHLVLDYKLVLNWNHILNGIKVVVLNYLFCCCLRFTTHFATSVHHLCILVTLTTFQEVSVGEQKSLLAIWFLEDQAVTSPFAEEEVPGNLCFPSGAHSCFSECFSDSCSQPSVAQSGMLLEHIWIKKWWLGFRGLVPAWCWAREPSAGPVGSVQSWGWGINGCSFGCSRPESAFHKLLEIKCLIWITHWPFQTWGKALT